MPTACCCYIIDPGYLFPTLVSAIQARAAVPEEVADIKIFCVGRIGTDINVFRRICDLYGIQLIAVAPKVINDMPIMFGRFYLNRLLETYYQEVLYIDGDTQISGSLRPLLTAKLEPGRFLAARDPMAIMIESPGRQWRDRRSYFTSIGIREDVLVRYCNSGVLRFNRSDWEVISRAVLRISAVHDHGFKFPDQDALNLHFGNDYLIMSYKWNFPIFFLDCGFSGLINPVIYHFMSNPRPWNGPFRPWGRAWNDPYLKVVKAYPELAPFNQPFGRLKSIRYFAQQYVKSVLERPEWTHPGIRDRIERYEAEAFV